MTTETPKRKARMISYSIPSPEILWKNQYEVECKNYEPFKNIDNVTQVEREHILKRLDVMTYEKLGFRLKTEYSEADITAMYYELIGKMCYLRLKHKEDAEDLCHSIFLRIFRTFKSFDHSRVAECVSLHCQYAHVDWTKHMVRSAGDPNMMYSMYDPDFNFKDPESHETDPFLNYLRDNAGICLSNKLTMLSMYDAKVFSLYYLSDCDTDYISNILGVTKIALYTRISRIRKELSTCYSTYNLEDLV